MSKSSIIVLIYHDKLVDIVNSSCILKFCYQPVHCYVIWYFFAFLNTSVRAENYFRRN
jgi:hypothetical protein